MSVREDDFRQSGAQREETENLINEAMRLAGVEVAVMLVENPQQENPNATGVRVSLRSRRKVDVARLAARFGGGGHKRAAGFRDNGDLDVIKVKIIQTVGEALETL